MERHAPEEIPGHVYFQYNEYMIMNDQPTIFSDNVTVRVSDVSDGTMSLRSLPENPDEVWQNRKGFITASGGALEKSALVYVTYDDGDDFCRYREADVTDFGITTNRPCDALVTSDPGVGLFLPIADCCAVVLYDPTTGSLMLSHIGRHSCVQYGAQKSVEYLEKVHGVNPRDLLVWLSPAVGADNYPIIARDNHALKDLVVDDLVNAGVPIHSIEVSSIDTAKDANYFSHSEYRQGRRLADGRFAVAAFITHE